jgi:hypothetical protein
LAGQATRALVDIGSYLDAALAAKDAGNGQVGLRGLVGLGIHERGHPFCVGAHSIKAI